MRHKDKINQIKKKLTPVFAKNGVIKAIVFGSMAKETHSRRSDLDLMIILNTEKRFFDRYEMFDEVHDIVGDRAVEMLIYTPEELARISHRPFIDNILKTGRVIYEH